MASLTYKSLHCPPSPPHCKSEDQESKKKEEAEAKPKMADNSNISYQAGQAAGQAQVKKDDMVNKAQQGAERAGGFLHQTGEQVMHMAQGATDAVKNAVGMGGSGGPNKQ